MMKTENGWIREQQCGKPSKPLEFAMTFVCALCGRRASDEIDLCFPVRSP